jgi:hypothetical protein
MSGVRYVAQVKDFTGIMNTVDDLYGGGWHVST